MIGWIRERLGGERRPIEVQIEAPLPPPRSAAALFYQIAREELNHQFAMAAEFDRKTATAFTIGSTIRPVTAGLLSTDRDALTANETAVSAILAGFVCYLLLGGCFVIALGSARLDRPPSMAAWDEEIAEEQEDYVYVGTGTLCRDACLRNGPTIRRKARWSALALYALGGEVLLLTVGVLAPLWPF